MADDEPLARRDLAGARHPRVAIRIEEKNPPLDEDIAPIPDPRCRRQKAEAEQRKNE
jgi:hypothetical protein